MKLSKAQQSALHFMALVGTPKSFTNTSIRRDTVHVLCKRGLLEWVADGKQFQITPAGRNALKEAE